MIKAHNIRHALLGALVFITVGSFGACSTDPTAPDIGTVSPPAQNLSSKNSDSCQTVDGTTACTTESATALAQERCILINGVWCCTGGS